MTTATSGKAHDKAACVDESEEKRAMLVCRVIAGRVKKNIAEGGGMESLYSSNLVMVFCVLWTLRMRSILHTGDCFFSQLEWNIISTMFLLVSSGPSSETEIGKKY